jgi:peptide chain release factor subunit 1
MVIDFEPFRPINTSLYFCDNRFHIEELAYLLENDQQFGFIVVDGHGALYATLQGNAKEVSSFHNLKDYQQIQCRVTKKTWSRRSVFSAFCTSQNRKEAQLLAKSVRASCFIFHSKRQTNSDWSCVGWFCRFQERTQRHLNV